MNWSNLAIAAETLSSIAVLATLIYLAIQTRQNTQATQANGRQMSASLDIQLCLSQAENADTFAHAHDPELTGEQKVFFDGHESGYGLLRETLTFSNAVTCFADGRAGSMREIPARP